MASCPRCRAALVPDLRAPPRHARCPRGHGVWVEGDDLRRALPRDAQAALDKAPAREGGGACPGCAGAMRIHVVARGGARVEVDACPRCRGWWLDEGELGRVRAAAKPEDEAAWEASRARSGGGSLAPEAAEVVFHVLEGIASLVA